MYIKEYEYIEVILNNERQVNFWKNKYGLNIILNIPFKIHWSLLKTKKEHRKLFLKVKCDDCEIIHDRRIRDLSTDNNIHYCINCLHKGERGPMFGLYGENNPNFGKLRESIKGDKNPAKRPEVREKISKALTGRIGNNLGKKHSNETIEKIRNSNLGKKRSKETIEKIREKRKLQIGDKCPGWKGGVTPIVRLARNNNLYSDWRKEVFERDNYICQLCQCNKKFLNAHHIIGVYERLDLIYNIDNGITLCKECHMNFHNKYGRKEFPNILTMIKEIK